jgi:hypothetical protein
VLIPILEILCRRSCRYSYIDSTEEDREGGRKRGLQEGYQLLMLNLPDAFTYKNINLLLLAAYEVNF